MSNIIEFMSNYWVCFVVGAILGAGTGIMIYNFSTKTKTEKIKEVKSWLLYAVRCAEDEFGSKTGKIKLGFVYDLFISRFPSVAKFLTFDVFKQYVDEALEKIEESLEEEEEDE